jgi:4-hydroxyacetophenone monooxygenase
VVVIGAGLNGISAAIVLKAVGIPFVILEQNPDLGGTWYRNRYPGARVDIASLSYCYTHEPFYPWKHYFAEQEELVEYLWHCVAKHDLASHFRFDTRVEGLLWSRERQLWEIETRDPNGTERLEARFVISAIGLFGKARLPKIAGLESFQGRLVHSAEWDAGYDVSGKRVAVIGTGSVHSAEWDAGYDVSGKRVAVIGTGSSGVQLVAPIAARAQELCIFQRTPAWLANVRLARYRAWPERLPVRQSGLLEYRAWSSLRDAGPTRCAFLI